MRHTRCRHCGDLVLYEGKEPKACKRCNISPPETRMDTGQGKRGQHGFTEHKAGAGGSCVRSEE